MIQPDPSAAAAPTEPAAPTAPERSIPELVAEVYDAAPDIERGRLLEQLLRPLGVLSLFGIAGGVFANIRLRSGWPELHVQLDDIRNVHAAQVCTLVDLVQQVSVETVDGLTQLLTTSPMLSGSAAAVVLVAALLRRARLRQLGPATPDATAPYDR